jgi:phosphate uptake regulator
MRRAFLVTLSMAESIHEMLEKGENIHLKDLTSLEASNNQLSNFCQRVLNKKGYPDSRKTTNLYVAISLLENIGDSYKFICLYMSKPEYKKYKVSKETLDFFSKVNNMLKDYYTIFYNKDEKKLVAISDARYEIPELAYKLMEKRKMPETAIISYLLEVYHRILDSLDPYTSMQY